MGTSPDFERLRRAILRQGEPDRVPLAELLIERDVKEAFLGRLVTDLQTEVEFWLSAGYDYVPLQAGILGVGQVQKDTARATRVKYSLFQEGDQELLWAEEGRGSIATLAEFESYPWPSARDLDYSAFDEVKRYLPRQVKVIAILGKVFTAVWTLMGLETFCTALTDDPNLVERMFQRVGSIQYEVLKALVGFDVVGAIWMPDDIAYSEGLMVAPKYLRRYLFPWFRRMGELCKRRGLAFIYHSDGRLYEVLDDIIAAGYDALHPIEPKAMDIVYLKKRVGNRLGLIGNIDLGYTLTRGTPQEVEAEVKQRLREVAPGGGYCVGSSNSVTSYVPLANYNAMRETVLQYGAYPLSV